MHSIELFLMSHIQRKANKVVDHLTNAGVNCNTMTIRDSWDNIRATQLGETCATLENQDHLDACD